MRERSSRSPSRTWCSIVGGPACLVALASCARSSPTPPADSTTLATNQIVAELVVTDDGSSTRTAEAWLRVAAPAGDEAAPQPAVILSGRDRLHVSTPSRDVDLVAAEPGHYRAVLAASDGDDFTFTLERAGEQLSSTASMGAPFDITSPRGGDIAKDTQEIHVAYSRAFPSDLLFVYTPELALKGDCAYGNAAIVGGSSQGPTWSTIIVQAFRSTPPPCDAALSAKAHSHGHVDPGLAPSGSSIDAVQLRQVSLRIVP